MPTYIFSKSYPTYYKIEAKNAIEARKKLDECDDLTDYEMKKTIEDYQQEFEFVETIKEF